MGLVPRLTGAAAGMGCIGACMGGDGGGAACQAAGMGCDGGCMGGGGGGAACPAAAVFTGVWKQLGTSSVYY